ncbi:MAG: UpxY family transcription antiterminator [Bacteroidaceae bacterium]|nr:UpxY family transcription antiterminator [Bacteroidaceae bacterium]
MPTNPLSTSERHWYVAYTKLFHERKTAENLQKMGIRSFVPIREEIHQWSQRKKKVMKVLIPQMIFIYATPTERLEALTLSAISHYMVLRGEHTPAVIPNDQMERFMFMVDYSDETIEMFTSTLEIGQTVKVIKGPLNGLKGELVEIEGKSKVVVRLDMLGCAGVDMPAGYVEAL